MREEIQGLVEMAVARNEPIDETPSETEPTR
jgi:hypothetical protein